MTDKKFVYFGISAIVLAFITIIVTVSVHDWFSWTNNALSDLGAIGTDYAAIYNWGMIVTGGLGIVFGIGLTKYFNDWIPIFGSGIFILGMFFLSLVGWFESGTEPHVTVSWLFFGITAIGIFIIGVGETIKKKKEGIAVLIIIFVGFILAYWTAQTYSGAAMPEMVGAIGFSIFTLIYSYRILETNHKE